MTILHAVLHPLAEHRRQFFVKSSLCQQVLHTVLQYVLLVNLDVEVHGQPQIVGKGSHQPVHKAVDGTYRQVGIVVQYGTANHVAALQHFVGGDEEVTSHFGHQVILVASGDVGQRIHDTFLHSIGRLVGECDGQDLRETFLQLGRRRDGYLYELAHQGIGFTRSCRSAAYNKARCRHRRDVDY